METMKTLHDELILILLPLKIREVEVLSLQMFLYVGLLWVKVNESRLLKLDYNVYDLKVFL